MYFKWLNDASLMIAQKMWHYESSKKNCHNFGQNSKIMFKTSSLLIPQVGFLWLTKSNTSFAGRSQTALGSAATAKHASCLIEPS